MKKTDIKYYSIAVALAAVSLAGASCDREEDDIWSQSSAERLEQAQSDDRKILCSAPNGWQMLYFCNGQEQGYNFLMKFDEHGGVTIATRNPNTSNAYAEEASMYDVLADDGPVLSFSTYNTLFHRYADPDPEHTQGSDGIGSGGDYEFNIMTIADTMIYLHGKKTKIDIYMYPLEEGKDWQEYFSDLYALRDSMFHPSVTRVWLTLADGSRYSIDNAYSQLMSFVPEGGDSITQTVTVPYVMTETGFRLMEAFPNDSADVDHVQEFRFDESGRYLIGDDATANGSIATIKSAAPASVFQSASTIWYFDANAFTGAFAAEYDKLITEFEDFFNGYHLYNIGFRVLGNRNCFMLKFGPTLASSREAYFYYDLVTEGDNVSFVFSGECDNNGVAASRCAEVGEFIDMIGTNAYAIETYSDVNPKRLTFSNDNGGFSVDLQ